MGITVVVPTIGRSTLRSCLASFAYQLEPGDAVVVIADGKDDLVLKIVQEFASLAPQADWTYDWIDPQGYWGHPAANYALDHHVVTSHVWRLDDDDEAQPGALAAMREHHDDPWTIFRMTFGPGSHAYGVTCWREQTLRYGDIGTPMVLAATGGGARYGRKYEGDWDYAEQLQALYGKPAWDERVVALIRPVVVVPLAP